MTKSYWSGVLAMSCCAFVLVASEFMPVSLLTPIASDLRISEGLAGWGIGISGIFAVITSLLLPQLAVNFDRRNLLLCFTALMGFSGVVIGLADSYIIYMFGRILIGIVVGGFWSLSISVAIRLVNADEVPKALAIFNGGNALAMVLAPPLGSYLGEIIGWRGVFWLLVPLAIITIIWQRLSMPNLPSDNVQKSANPFRLLKVSAVITLGFIACGLFFMGQFSLFTYVRPFLEQITQISNAQTLSVILFLMGIMGFIGSMLIIRFLQHYLYRTLISVCLMMSAVAVLLMILGSHLWITVILLAFWGLIGTSLAAGWWSWLAQSLPNDSETGGGLMVAIIQLCIGLGSIVGGILFDINYQLTFIFSAIMLLISAIMLIFLTNLRKLA